MVPKGHEAFNVWISRRLSLRLHVPTGVLVWRPDRVGVSCLRLTGKPLQQPAWQSEMFKRLQCLNGRRESRESWPGRWWTGGGLGLEARMRELELQGLSESAAMEACVEQAYAALALGGVVLCGVSCCVSSAGPAKAASLVSRVGDCAYVRIYDG